MDAERWQRIKQVFNSALELEPDRREAFLQEACGSDVPLLKEIERLLAREGDGEDLLGAPALEVAAKAVAQERREEPVPDYVGRSLLHYRITEKIGEGGMGVVYRAEDLHLNRPVAIKVLPDVFAEDAERMARFEREARLLATLNHPNIASIYGLEKQANQSFLVLELVEGLTLEERLIKGPIPIDDALDICCQIADGLETAHDKGIIHRDLKPANVKITPEGKVKVLDFGLAKVLYEQAAPIDPSRSPTITEQMTAPGVILGTAAYMSPEQARGKPVDKRADIWAFGCVLYECLTGRRAFEGDTITETVAAILKNEPDWTLLPAETPLFVRAVLKRCLQKDPKERLHDIADVQIEVREGIAQPPETTTVLRRFSLAWLVACAAVTLLAGFAIDRVLTSYLQHAPTASVLTATIKVETGHWLDGGRRPWELQHPSRTAMAISSDGSFVVYSAIEENPGAQARSRLYLRRMSQSQAKPISGTEGGINPFLSPDDRWVGFWGGLWAGEYWIGTLKKVPVEGGVATALCDSAGWIYGANWGRDNSVVFADGESTGLSRVSAEGGKPETLTKPDRKREEYSHRLPSWLPDGKTVLFTVMRHSFDSHPWLAVLRMDTREWHVLLQDAADGRYVRTGHLVFLRQGTLMAVRFDLTRLEVVGQPVALVEDVMQAFSTATGYHTGAGQFSISGTGSLIYAAGGIVSDQKRSLVWVDQRGVERQVTDLQFPFGQPRLSPDGQRIAYATAGRERQVWVYDLSRGTNSRLTSEGRATCPVWTPDGRRLLFAWHKSLEENLFWQPYDGSAPMERLTTSEYSQHPGSWLSDGKTVALVEALPDAQPDIVVLDVRSRRVTPFLNSQFNEEYPEFSPDGRWLAYMSDESERGEVYVRPFPGPGIKQQVSSDGGTQPLWARNGKQLFYRRQDQVYVVDVQTDGSFAATKPRLLFERRGYGAGGWIRNYDLSLDGKQFLMVKNEERKPRPVTELILVQNWLEELKRLVPVK